MSKDSRSHKNVKSKEKSGPKGSLSLKDLAGATIVLSIGENGNLTTNLTIGGVNLNGGAGPLTDIEGELPGDEEVDTLRSFYRKCVRLEEELKKGRKAGTKEKRRFYSATLTFPDEVKRSRIYPLITKFAKIIARRPGEGVWAVANTRPCKDKDCMKLFERLRKEKKLPFGLHFHCLIVTSLPALKAKGIWVNRSGASKSGSKLKDIKGKGQVFNDGLNRVILYHTATAAHLGMPLKKRVVCRGVLGEKWTKATGWKSMNRKYNPLKGLSECGRDPTDLSEEALQEMKAKAKRFCKCGCGEAIDDMDPRARFLNHSHAMRWKRKTEKEEGEKAKKDGKGKGETQAARKYRKALEKEEARFVEGLQLQMKQEQEYQRALNEDMEGTMDGQGMMH